MKALRYFIFLLLTLSGCEKQELPRIITAEISSINQTSAICGGYIISEGSSEVISKGICYNTSADPTIQDDSITIDSGVRNFTTTLTGLEINTTYFVRAYATNSLGTSYGKTKSFTTDPPYLSKVTTISTTSITETSAKSGGEVTSDGGSQIIDRGVCWSKSQNPDSSELAENKISAGSGLGYFYVTITGLESNTDYFIRAYATNFVGTSYGEPRLCATFKVNPDYPVDPNYPTTIYRLNPDTLSQKRIDFAEKNKYLQSSLNKFGFCIDEYLIVEAPPNLGKVTREGAIEIVKSFALKNPSETGIENPNELTFDHILSGTSNDGGTYWYFVSSCQKIDTGDVFNSYISFNLKNSEVVYCTGNWFPDIYIPENYNIDPEQVKSYLLGRVLKFTGFSGECYSIVTLNDLNSYTTKLSIFPLRTNEKIELRVTWQIMINSLFYIVYVDVMTGQILYGYTTINY